MLLAVVFLALVPFLSLAPPVAASFSPLPDFFLSPFFSPALSGSVDLSLRLETLPSFSFFRLAFFPPSPSVEVGTLGGSGGASREGSSLGAPPRVPRTSAARAFFLSFFSRLSRFLSSLLFFFFLRPSPSPSAPPSSSGRSLFFFTPSASSRANTLGGAFWPASPLLRRPYAPAIVIDGDTALNPTPAPPRPSF